MRKAHPFVKIEKMISFCFPFVFSIFVSCIFILIIEWEHAREFKVGPCYKVQKNTFGLVSQTKPASTII